MGAKGSKDKPQQPQPNQPAEPKPVVIPAKAPATLTDADYAFLTSQTHMPKEDIKNIFDKFMANNPDEKLDRKEFVRLYSELRPEPPELLDEISHFIFAAFDSDKNGFINFNDLTSRGDLKKKLEYAFELYDADNNGYLDSNEIKTVLTGMFDLLGADKRSHNVQDLTNDCMRELDTTKDGKVTRDEFVSGLLKNYSLRSLMSPFN